MTPEEFLTKVEDAKNKLGAGPNRRLGGAPIIQAVVALPDLEPQDFHPPDDPFLKRLLWGPGDILEKQAAFDEADRAYKTRLAALTLDAFRAPLFPGKKDGDPMRPAGNDAERDAALDSLASTDPQLVVLVQARELAQRELSLARNLFEGAKYAVQYLTDKAK
jgi:hypothetical protein